MILTAARTGEVLGAIWSEFDLDGGVWTVPAVRMKARRDHRVPLSVAAIALLRKLATIRQNDFVFAGQDPSKPLSNMALLMALRRMKRGDLTAHGFRSTRHGLVVDARLTPATGTAEREAALEMLGDLPAGGRITVGADKAHDTRDFVARARELGATPHVGQNINAHRRSNTDARATRHDGYASLVWTRLTSDRELRF